MTADLRKRDRYDRYDLLCLLLAPVLPLVMLFALTYPPVIVSQGEAHRIFYNHVPVAWAALYGPLISSVAGLLYLFRRKEIYDLWSSASAKVAYLFAWGVVISGPLWAATEWGNYWNWNDPRLMSFFLLLMALSGYFLVRNLTEDPRNRAIFSAFMSILSALVALITWFAIRLVEPDTHPTSVLGEMSPRIRTTFWISVLGYHIFFLIILRLALRLEILKNTLHRLAARYHTDY